MTSPHIPHHEIDDPAIEVIRHEEHLLVDTERSAVERVRFDRVVVTEQRTITVDVSHEEIRLTREPITDGSPLPVGTAAPEREPIVVVLHEEQVIVSKTVVPVERVVLTTRTVTDDRLVEETVSHEEIDVDPSVHRR